MPHRIDAFRLLYEHMRGSGPFLLYVCVLRAGCSKDAAAASNTQLFLAPSRLLAIRLFQHAATAVAVIVDDDVPRCVRTTMKRDHPECHYTCSTSYLCVSEVALYHIYLILLRWYIQISADLFECRSLYPISRQLLVCITVMFCLYFFRPILSFFPRFPTPRLASLVVGMHVKRYRCEVKLTHSLPINYLLLRAS